MFINLRDFYPYYTCDAFVEVSDEIGAVLLESKREEKNYIDRLGYHKAYYSLDRGDGIENDAVDKPMTPEDAYIHKAVMAELYAAFASLPDKQAKRLYALFFMGMSRTEIAKAEGVALCAAGVDEALQVAALVVEGRLGHGEGAALHDGPERVVRLREPGEHAQGPGLRKGDVEPLSGAGVTGEAQPGSEGCVAEQGAFLGAGFGGGEDEALAALADAAGQGE